MHKNPSEDVEKKDDHSYDSWRYAVMSWDAEAEVEPMKPDSEFALSVIEEEIDERYEEEMRGIFN